MRILRVGARGVVCIAGVRNWYGNSRAHFTNCSWSPLSSSSRTARDLRQGLRLSVLPRLDDYGRYQCDQTYQSGHRNRHVPISKREIRCHAPQCRQGHRSQNPQQQAQGEREQGHQERDQQDTHRNTPPMRSGFRLHLTLSYTLAERQKRASRQRTIQ
jgi:hypothetical protein